MMGDYVQQNHQGFICLKSEGILYGIHKNKPLKSDKNLGIGPN